jgi:hypothetical protein
MVSRTIISSPRGALSSDQELYLARFYLENAHKERDPKIVLVFVYESEISLSRMKRYTKHAEDIATVHRDLSDLLKSYGYHHQAQAFHKKADKSRYVFC